MIAMEEEGRHDYDCHDHGKGNDHNHSYNDQEGNNPNSFNHWNVMFLEKENQAVVFENSNDEKEEDNDNRHDNNKDGHYYDHVDKKEDNQ